MVPPTLDLTMAALLEAPRIETVSQLVRYLAQLAGLNLKSLHSGQTPDHRLWAAAIADRTDLTFSRWYIRCQSEELATLDTVATVTGLAWEIRPNVLVLAVLGKISEDAWTFVADVNRNSTFRFVCLDANDLLNIGTDRSRFLSMLERRSSPDFLVP